MSGWRRTLIGMSGKPSDAIRIHLRDGSDGPGCSVSTVLRRLRIRPSRSDWVALLRAPACRPRYSLAAVRPLARGEACAVGAGVAKVGQQQQFAVLHEQLPRFDKQAIQPIRLGHVLRVHQTIANPCDCLGTVELRAIGAGQRSESWQLSRYLFWHAGVVKHLAQLL
jgi:hypothetical protein